MISFCQMEATECGTGLLGRGDSDGVHMQVQFFFYFILMQIFALLILMLSITDIFSIEETDFFLCSQIVLQGQDSRSPRIQHVGEKAFRCDHEGCGKLYTTAHHLKVKSHQMSHTGHI